MRCRFQIVSAFISFRSILNRVDLFCQHDSHVVWKCIVNRSSLDRHIRMKRIDMAMKLDHELHLTRRRSWDMQNFEADLSMMVSRPSEANLEGKRTKYNFCVFCFSSKIGRDRVRSRPPRVEGVEPEAGEARRGPKKAK